MRRASLLILCAFLLFGAILFKIKAKGNAMDSDRTPAPRWMPPAAIEMNGTSPLHTWLLEPDVTAFLRAQAKNPLLNYAISFAKRRADADLFAEHFTELFSACDSPDLPTSTRCVLAQSLLDADGLATSPVPRRMMSDDQRLKLIGHVYNGTILYNYCDAMILLDAELRKRYPNASDEDAAASLSNHGWQIDASDISSLRSRFSKK